LTIGRCCSDRQQLLFIFCLVPQHLTRRKKVKAPDGWWRWRFPNAGGRFWIDVLMSAGCGKIRHRNTSARLDLRTLEAQLMVENNPPRYSKPIK
jgi:hypothetical protein